MELLECALNQNTIACVNTQNGKQFLSTMLIRELMIKYDDENGKKNYLKLAVSLLNEGCFWCFDLLYCLILSFAFFF